VRDRAGLFDWSGGHPALDLVNTLDERPFPSPIENLATFGDLVRFTDLAGLIDRPLARQLAKLRDPSCSLVAKKARKLREHLHEVLQGMHAGRRVAQEDLAAINHVVQTAHAARTLRTSASGGLVRHRWSQPFAADVPLHACALAVEELLVEVDRKRIRKCRASDCGVYFVDTSKGHRRQWCSMSNCGNREKQRRWRAS
jgi:predicted RNA-binding Zn ribbon-like protein